MIKNEIFGSFAISVDSTVVILQTIEPQVPFSETIMPSAPDVEIAAMTAQHNEEDSKEDYDMVLEPKTRSGLDIKWQCELRRTEDERPENDKWWVDYTPVYNTVLELSLIHNSEPTRQAETS